MADSSSNIAARLYDKGYRWCSFCGEWVQNARFKEMIRCPDCGYRLRLHPRRKAQAKLHRYD
jgi:DNA-directed RNA polymerase subunit RPC12/RpoP